MVCYYHETKTGWLILELELSRIAGIMELLELKMELLELELEFVEITGI